MCGQCIAGRYPKAMASPTADLERLREQQRLLEEARAAGPAGRQRTVQAQLLAETRAELAVALRCQRAVDAGWEPFEPASEWFQGYVEDPRFLHGRVRLASVLLALPIALLLSVGAWSTLNVDALPTAALGLVLWLGLEAALLGVLGRVAERRDARLIGEARVYNAPMPARALLAYRRARTSGLFDTFTVCSPRAQDFCAVALAEAPSLGLLDPVLAGHIGRRSFLIAQWDLAADLAQV